jgi:hypothetical protein
VASRLRAVGDSAPASDDASRGAVAFARAVSDFALASDAALRAFSGSRSVADVAAIFSEVVIRTILTPLILSRGLFGTARVLALIGAARALESIAGAAIVLSQASGRAEVVRSISGAAAVLDLSGEAE